MSYGTVTRRLAKISHQDWNLFTSRFLRAFDSQYNEKSDITVTPGIYIPVGFAECTISSMGLLDRASLNQGLKPLELKDIEFDDYVARRLREAPNEKLFAKIPSIEMRVSPHSESELAGKYAFCVAKFTRRRPHDIFFYYQGTAGLELEVMKEFRPKSKEEQVLYIITCDIGYNIDRLNGELSIEELQKLQGHLTLNFPEE